MSETQIVNQIMQYLNIRGVMVWRANTGVRGRVRFGRNGQGDITGILPDGRRLEIECKTKTGVQSEAQKKFAEEIRENGGVYILARCVDDVVAELYKEKSNWGDLS